MENHASAGSLESRKQLHEISLLASSTPKTRIFSRAGLLAHGDFHLHRTFPTPQACRTVSARHRVSGSGLLFEARRLLEPPGEVFSAYSGGGHAGFSPASLSRLPLSIEGVRTRKALCYSMKISDGSQIEGLARPALLLVCAGLPRASGLGANAITRMVYLFPSSPRPG